MLISKSNNKKAEPKENCCETVTYQAELMRAIIEVASLFSVSGSEYKSAQGVEELYGEFFDSVESDSVGNIIFFKSCGRENAPKIMVDTHFDEIGFMVTDALDG